MVRYILSPSVKFREQPDEKVVVFNGLNAQWTITKAAANLLKAFSSPRNIGKTLNETGAPDEAQEFMDLMVKNLILVPEHPNHENDMRLAWDCLAQGADRDAAYVIDNETKSMEDFRVAGDDGVTALNNLIPLHPSWNVVNIGCGMGRLELPLSRRVGQIYAFDVSEKMLERAAQYLAECANVTLCRTDWRLADIDDNQIDLVISFLVFQHCPQDITWRYFREAYRVLKPGARFVFQIHCYEDDVGFDSASHSPLARYYGAGKARYREKDVMKNLVQAGFSIEFFREGSHDGMERRLSGTASPTWQSNIVCAAKY